MHHGGLLGRAGGALGLLACLAGCPAGSGPPDFGGPPVDAAPGDGGPPDLLNCAGGYLNSTASDACPLACSPRVRPVPDEGRAHVPMFTSVTYGHNPPASGPHWPTRAPWGQHPQPVAREWYVHNLEHGGILLLYNCPAGCPDVVDTFVELYNQQVEPVFPERRILIAPDPQLPEGIRLTAVAWDWVYFAGSVNRDELACFIRARYGRGPEQAS